MPSLARLPIRIRLTLAFAVVMAVVLAAVGLFLYVRLAAALDEAIDDSLRSRTDEVAALVGTSDSALREGGSGLTNGSASFAQVLGADGKIVDATPEVAERPLIRPSDLARARRAPVIVERRGVVGSDDPVRLLAAPLRVRGRELVVVAGASLEGRGEALEGLLAQLLLGGPLALVVSSLAAFVLASAALRPVEKMRREAEGISAAEPGRRLPRPAARDEISRLAETLNEMLGRLEAALARERRFVADASHELRTPLAALRAELELALRRERPPRELERALHSAAEETERLTQLAEDLLVLARAEGGALPVRRERISAAELLGGVKARYGRRAEAAGRTVDVDVDMNGNVEFLADRLRLEQALGNLVENALRHGRGRVVASARSDDGRIELHVRDDGSGFAPDFVAHAFEPFTRGSAPRSAPGAGLGLAIVDVIARAHGGSAHAANVDGGADVWLELPDA